MTTALSSPPVSNGFLLGLRITTIVLSALCFVALLALIEIRVKAKRRHTTIPVTNTRLVVSFLVMIMLILIAIFPNWPTNVIAFMFDQV